MERSESCNITSGNRTLVHCNSLAFSTLVRNVTKLSLRVQTQDVLRTNSIPDQYLDVDNVSKSLEVLIELGNVVVFPWEPL